MDEENIEEFFVFLRSRDVPETTIQQLHNDKIDPQVIKLMDVSDLQTYFPKYGDRLAVMDFCGIKSFSKSKRKLSIIEKFKCKLKAKETVYKPIGEEKSSTSQESFDLDQPTTSSYNAHFSGPPKKSRPKQNRQIFMGWLMIQKDGTRVQIKEKQGGGTRKPIVSKDSKKEDLLNLGKNLFFPNGVSLHKGKLEDYNIDIKDFQMNVLSENISVGELFSVTQLSHLRFYFTTTPKQESVSTINEDTPDDKDQESSVIISDNEFSFHDEEFDTIDTYDNYPNNYDDLNPRPVNIESAPTNSPVSLVVHRGQVFEDFLSAFQDLPLDCGPIVVSVILLNGDLENAVDVGGVFRDCLSEFWQTFFDKCSLGTDYKVPAIRHDYQEQEWGAIGKILVKGWTVEKYFPIELAQAFVQQCMFSKTWDIMESFRLYVSPPGREILDNCLKDFSTVDNDDLYDFLQEFECKKKPSSSNIQEILHEIAYKELIQKPMFIINQWEIFMRNMMTKKELEVIYDELKPSPKNILKVINCTCSKVEEEIVYNYLKKFIKESNPTVLKAFLRFSTGSDLVIGKPIEILFNNRVGLVKTPVAHVCSCTLEIPLNYESFPEFRSEFNNLLTSKVWVMDIV